MVPVADLDVYLWTRTYQKQAANELPCEPQTPQKRWIGFEYSYSILRYPVLYPPFLPSLFLLLPYSCVSPSNPISSGVYAHYSRSRIVVSIPEPTLLTQLPVPSS